MINRRTLLRLVSSVPVVLSFSGSVSLIEAAPDTLGQWVLKNSWSNKGGEHEHLTYTHTTVDTARVWVDSYPSNDFYKIDLVYGDEKHVRFYDSTEELVKGLDSVVTLAVTE
jgi:hypothetical protein